MGAVRQQSQLGRYQRVRPNQHKLQNDLQINIGKVIQNAMWRK